MDGVVRHVTCIPRNDRRSSCTSRRSDALLHRAAPDTPLAIVSRPPRRPRRTVCKRGTKRCEIPGEATLWDGWVPERNERSSFVAGLAGDCERTLAESRRQSARARARAFAFSRSRVPRVRDCVIVIKFGTPWRDARCKLTPTSDDVSIK